MKKISLIIISFCLSQTLMAQDGPFTFNGKTRIFTGNAIHWNADQDASTNLIWRSWSNRYFDFNGTVFRQDGKVGLGVTTPVDKLTVDGNIQIYHPDNQYYNSPSSLTLLNNALVFKHQHGNKNAEIRGAISPGKHTTGLVFRTKSTYSTSLENRMIIHPDGNVGIGTTSPDTKLHIEGSGVSIVDATYQQQIKGTGTKAGLFLSHSGNGGIIGYANLGSGGLSNTFYITTGSAKIGNGGFVMDGSGNVGINTLSPEEKLEVNGNALIDGELYTKKVKVSVNPGNWPDYVFEDSYQLMEIGELEQYIKTKKHLPEVPSAAAIEKEGLDLGNMDATLLKKVEELTLYMIEMKKEIEVLKKENKKLSDEVNKVRK